MGKITRLITGLSLPLVITLLGYIGLHDCSARKIEADLRNRITFSVPKYNQACSEEAVDSYLFRGDDWPISKIIGIPRSLERIAENRHYSLGLESRFGCDYYSDDWTAEFRPTPASESNQVYSINLNLIRETFMNVYQRPPSPSELENFIDTFVANRISMKWLEKNYIENKVYIGKNRFVENLSDIIELKNAGLLLEEVEGYEKRGLKGIDLIKIKNKYKKTGLTVKESVVANDNRIEPERFKEKSFLDIFRIKALLGITPTSAMNEETRYASEIFLEYYTSNLRGRAKVKGTHDNSDELVSDMVKAMDDMRKNEVFYSGGRSYSVDIDRKKIRVYIPSELGEFANGLQEKWRANNLMYGWVQEASKHRAIQEIAKQLSHGTNTNYDYIERVMKFTRELIPLPKNYKEYNRWYLEPNHFYDAFNILKKGKSGDFVGDCKHYAILHATLIATRGIPYKFLRATRLDYFDMYTSHVAVGVKIPRVPGVRSKDGFLLIDNSKEAIPGTLGGMLYFSKDRWETL